MPHDVRQRYVNMFTEEFLKTSPTVRESFEKVGRPDGRWSPEGLSQSTQQGIQVF